MAHALCVHSREATSLTYPDGDQLSHPSRAWRQKHARLETPATGAPPGTPPQPTAGAAAHNPSPTPLRACGRAQPPEGTPRTGSRGKPAPPPAATKRAS
eukprot:scaffold1112_cov116-Isochrysis_galbana.AAC.5